MVTSVKGRVLRLGAKSPRQNTQPRVYNSIKRQGAAKMSKAIPLLVSVSIFSVTFVLILTERVYRTVIGLAGAVLVVTLGTFLSAELSAIDPAV